MGNPIIGLTGSAVPVRSSDVMNKWAEKIFVRFNTSAASVNQVKSESLYQRFLKNSSALTNVPVLIPSAEESSVTPLAYVCAAEGQPEDLFPAAAISEVFVLSLVCCPVFIRRHVGKKRKPAVS